MNDYRHWQTPLSLEDVFLTSSSPSYLSAQNGNIYWVESLSQEGGRVVIKEKNNNGETRTVTPKGFNVRTKVNEYGGRAYIVANETVYFCNYSDQRVYRQNLSGNYAPIAVTSDCEKGKYVYFSDLCLSPCERFLVFVMETEDSVENRTEIGFIATNEENQTPSVLRTGADFYASLSLSMSGKYLAWVEWQHPNMPWDNTHCIIADINITGLETTEKDSGSHGLNSHDLRVENTQIIVENATAAHVSFLQDDSVVLTIDWAGRLANDVENYANLYRYQHNIKKLTPITQGLVEYSYPHWIFGNHRHAALNENTIIAIATTPEGDELHVIDLNSGTSNRVADEFCVFESVCVDQGVAYVIATSPTQSAQIIQVSLTGEVQCFEETVSQTLHPSMISKAELIKFESSDNDLVYANYYPARNSNYVQASSLGSESLSSSSQLSPLPPPLLVMVHGGPTARANNGFDILKQFWTSSGFAILDINHRGSSGFGRRYRDALLGQWGEVDALDIYDAISFVIEQKLADANAVFIRGKSAGGYAVQRALTKFPTLFKAGASYYGIGDLATLAEITHKFEKHYCDVLLGEVYDPKTVTNPISEYFKRSPIHFMERIQCPMILFQGVDDKVVPPALSEQVANVLEKQGVHFEYQVYEGEGHGFRKLDSQVDSLKRELTFYRAAMQA